MVTNLFSPDIEGVKPSYTKETANKYNEKIDEEMKKKEQETVIAETEKTVKNQKILTISNVIQNAIYTETLSESAYQFTQAETYDKTDINDKTDTYTNMNTSYRYIKFNIDGAGILYNQLSEGNDFKKDSPKKVFETIKNRLTQLGFNKKVNKQGKLEKFDIQDDKDLLYTIGFFQTAIENKVQDPSKKDFRVGPKTLTALLDDNNTLNHVEGSKQIEETGANITETNTDKIENSTNKTETPTNDNETTTNKNETPTDNTKTPTDKIENSVDTSKKTEQKEMIGTREFPKTKDIYKEGTEQYLFNKEDLIKRGITENMEYVQTIYETLQLDNNLDTIEDAENLKEMLIKPWFEQLDKVISDMKKGITINKKTYEFSDNEIRQAIKNRGFSQIIMKEGELYEVKFETRTPEMKRIERSVHPLGDKEYKESEGTSGKLKEKFQITPQGVNYLGVKGINNEKEVYQVKVGDRILYAKEQ